MSTLKNPLEILQLLDKSNCRECGESTCLAFAGAVFRGRRRLGECPKLDPEIVARVTGEGEDPASSDQARDEYLAKLKEGIAGIDLARAAERIGARFSGGKLTLEVLGKEFSVDAAGKLYADIHINPWVSVPFLHYVLYGKGVPAAGRWVSFRELQDGRERYPLFRKRCEEPMKNVADRHPDLFDYMVHVFSGKQVEKQFRSDISVVLHPLPRVPLMVCYWLPDGGLASSLNVFFDRTADQNLDIGALFSLGAGLAAMFEKLGARHGFEAG